MKYRSKRITKGILLIGAVVALAVVVGLALGNENAEAKTIIVDGDGEGNYTSIQSAIYAASNNDTIRVWEGTYEENIVIDKTVSLIGNGSANTTIDGGGEENKDVVRVEADWCNVSGFTVMGSDYPGDGIRVEGDHAKISDNNCSGNEDEGIYLYSCNFSEVSNNTIFSSRDSGIYLYHCNSSEVSNNTVSSSGDSGIYLKDSNNNTISNNTCTDNGDPWGDQAGLYIKNSDGGNYLYNNILGNNGKYGIYLKYSANHTLKGNRCSGNLYNFRAYGDHEYQFMHSIDASNTVEGEPIRYYVSNKKELVVDGLNTGYVGIIDSEKITLKNLDLSSNREGMIIAYSRNIAVRECDIHDNEDGLYIRYSQELDISLNRFRNNEGNGIFARGAENCTFKKNTFTNNSDTGIELKYSFWWNTISNNSFRIGKEGIYLRDSSWNVIDDNQIVNFTCDGIILRYSHNNTISNNNITEIKRESWVGDWYIGTYGTGILLHRADNNTITGNLIKNNAVGIEFSYYYDVSKNNLVAQNDIVGNSKYGVDATSGR